MDEFADQLLTQERVCEIQLPRMTQRKVLEETEGLPRRKSKLGKALGVLDDAAGDGDASDEDDEERGRYLSRSPSGSRSPTPEREKTPEYWTEGSEDEEEPVEKRRKEKSPESDRFVSRSPSPVSDRYVSRSPSPGSPGRMNVDTERIEGDV